MKIKFKNEHDIGTRIKERREELNLSRNIVCDMLGGISLTTLTLWEKNEREPTATKIIELSNILNVSTNYLLLGADDAPQALPMQSTSQSTADDDEYEWIDDCRDVVVTAGYGGINGDYTDIRKAKVETAWLAAHGLKARDCGLYKVTGDSMAETLKDKEDIIVHHASKKLIDGKIFVLNNEGSMLIKRVQLKFGTVELISDNKDYSPIKLTSEQAESLIVIGQLVRCYRDF